MDKLDTGAEAYDLREYDLKEYDLGAVDSRLYDYGAYDDYGTAPAKPTATYDDEVGPGVAAETEVSENSVSTTPWPSDWGCEHERHVSGILCWFVVFDSFCLPALLLVELCDCWFNDWQPW